MGADPCNLGPALGHEPHIDAALVVTVDEHHLLERVGADRLEEDAGEVPQGDTVLRFDDAKDVRIDVLDHHSGMPRSQLVDRLLLEVHPADPVASPVGNDLDFSVLASREQPPAILTEQRELTPIVSPVQAELSEQLQDPLFVLGGVFRLVQQLVDRRVQLENSTSVCPRRQVERLGAIEQVFHVEGRDPHCLSSRSGGAQPSSPWSRICRPPQYMVVLKGRGRSNAARPSRTAGDVMRGKNAPRHLHRR